MTNENKEPVLLYEDDDVVVVHKPSGLVVHPDGKTEEASLTEWLLKHYPSMKDVGEPERLSTGELILRPGIVHRLDRDTSGAIIAVKNSDAFAFFKKQFQDRTIVKKYHALLYGEIKNLRGTIDRPIAKSRGDFRLWSAQRGSRGQARDAVTKYHKLIAKGGFSLVEAEPKTGRTHHLRVHFKAINYPIINDPLYAPNRPLALGLDRLGLHSYSIEFAMRDGGRMEIVAPYPVDFATAVARLKSL